MMNCREAEQLIPLFVEIDLDAAAMQQVSAHVETCHSCRALIAEFHASQASLRAVALPTFDEAMLTEMRGTVLQQVTAPAMRPAFVEWVQLIWTWKFAVAAAAVILLIFSVAIRQRSGKSVDNPVASRAKEAQFTSPEMSENREANLPGTTPQPQPRMGRKSKAQGGVSVSERNPGNNKRRQPRPERATDVDHQIVAAIVPPGVENEAATFPRGDILGGTLPPAPQSETSVLPALPNLEKSASEPEMLRMEFQTADPNIRIIWLTPKSALAAK